MNKMKTIAFAGIASLGVYQVQAATILTTSDGVVKNSLCVGFDCSASESFGSDTIRLKENNLRINFEDTSVGSFPTNDWTIEANSNSSGGISYLAIRDDNTGNISFMVEAGARANALRVESDGDIGIGTANPVMDIHVVTGNTPTLRLDQDGSSGFAPQAWDVAGNETNFFIRDVTGGSRLPLRIRPGAPTSSIDIATTGNVGIGTSSPDYNLEVERSGQVTMALTDSAGESWAMVVNSAGGNDGFSITRAGTGKREFRIANDGNVYVNSTQVHPDYVFEPEYKLMPLAELGAFVAEHKHLPDVQSAADVNENGLNLSALPSQLLKKMEELTLYTLEQQKIIDDLKAQVAAQNIAIQQLK